MSSSRNSYRSLEKKETVTAYLFLLPSLIGFLFFVILPVIFLLYISFCDWNLFSGFSGMEFIGLENYKNFISDPYLKEALKNNIIFTLISVPILTILALIFAAIVNKGVFLGNVIQSMMFMPYISTLSAVAIVFISLYNGEFGPINVFLRNIGVQNPPNWLADPFWALPAIMILWIWHSLGYYMMIYIATLRDIPDMYYEAARIDGASTFQQFFHITLPLVSPTTFFLVVVGVINSFKLFPHVQIMTEGGPGSSTMVLIYHIYRTGFEFYEMGYASSLTWLFFVIVFIITIIQWKTQDKWVEYT